MDTAVRQALRSGEAAAVLAALVEETEEVLLTADPEILLRAREVCADDADGLPVAAAWRLGLGLHFNGRFAEALETFRRARVEENADPADRAELHAALASSLWGRAEVDECVREADLARQEAEVAGQPRPRASAWIARALVAAHAGDRTASRTAYEHALAHAEVAGARSVLIRVLTNLASLENEEGRYDAALAWVNRALDLWGADDGPMRCITAYNRADALLALGRLEEAIADLRSSQASARAVDAPLLAVALHGLGEAYRLRGDAARAAAAYREAVATAERTDQAQVIGDALAGLARTTVLEGLDAARALAERGSQVPTALGRVAPLLASGWIELLAGRPALAQEHAARAVLEAGRRSDPVGLAEALELQALASDPVPLDPIREAAGLWAEAGHRIGTADNAVIAAVLTGDREGERTARRHLMELGVRDDATRIAGPRQAVRGRSVPLVSVHLLGSFAVLVGERPVPASAWGSRKARDAVKYLAVRGGRPVSRDALAEVLWPGQRGTSARLSVVLSTLRSVLDPDKAHDPDRFVVADRATVRLDAEVVELDAVAFETSARRALDLSDRPGTDAVEALQEAIAHYNGPLLDDDQDQPWTDEPREHLAHLAREVRRRLAIRLGADQPERAVPWLVSLLSEDPYDEPCHLLLITSMLRLGRYGEARRAHTAYASAMAELDLPVTPLADLARDL
ncbi:tetratricopeptide repeat protein [Nocardioides sp. QY071]|uniref:tetratricopeptide repeat protein n=1 Tax=Nocardioides sp. QY071 TaxID=3044187 RepID=UPI00249C9197|nr:tetratricopeptide repeat protein [Nocardioides sp. QY071]WGY02841.1 tetratricopeptide repeat protein [Nocardioides sp. QY071]